MARLTSEHDVYQELMLPRGAKTPKRMFECPGIPPGRSMFSADELVRWIKVPALFLSACIFGVERKGSATSKHPPSAQCAAGGEWREFREDWHIG